MKAIYLLAIFCFTVLQSKAQHDPKFNFDYITYVNSSTPYNPNDATDNVHFTGYFNVGFNYFVYFPNGNCNEAYTVNLMAYIDGDTGKKMLAEFDDKYYHQFIVWPVLSPRPFDGDHPVYRGVDAFRYRKDKQGNVGTMSIH